MWVRTAACLAITLGLPLAAPLAASEAESACRETAPEEIRLALPWPEGDEPLEGGMLEVERGRLARILGSYYQRHGRCPEQRDLLVDVAFGSDYEILSWVGDGLVDVGYLSDVALYLLELDGIRVLELSDIDPLTGRGRTFELDVTSLDTSSGALLEGSRAELEDAFEWLHSLAVSIRDCRRERTRRRGSGECKDRETSPKYRLSFPSHLSTAGFAQPVAWLAARLSSVLGAIEDPDEAQTLRDEFWDALFRHGRFSIGDAAGGVSDRGVVELRFEAVPTPGGAPTPRAVDDLLSSRFSDTLVITAEAASRILDPKSAVALEEPSASLPEGFAALLAEGGPGEFRSLARPDPTIGVRTFAFTLEESVGFLRPHGRLTEPSKLALVLPGGGVKAAYQSGLIDQLYGQGRHLQNYLANGKPSDASNEPLEVDYVIGTSGGALLGYFVALLREDGPWDLTDRLWNLEGRTLASTDVFGWADLLRFLSFVAIFLVLCLWLAVLSLPRDAPLAPREPPAGLPRRLRLILALGPLLIASPIVIRVVNGEAAMEHIPVIEGIFYTVYLWVTMFADHSLILTKAEPGKHRASIGSAYALLGFGGLLVVAALTFQGQDWVHQRVAVWLAYVVLWPLAAIGGPVRALRADGGSSPVVVAVELIVVSLASYLLLATGLVTTLFGWLPQFLVAILLLMLIIGIHVYVKPRMARSHTRYLAWLLITSLFVMMLCRPAEGAGWGVLTTESGLGLDAGAFLVCIGLLLLFIGAACWTYCSDPRYELRAPVDFLSGLLVAVAHIVLVYLTLLGLVKFFPGLLSPLELTGTFWVGLLAISVVAGGLIAFVGVYLKSPGWLVDPLRNGLEYLCAHHPTSGLIGRRFLRIAVLAVLALGWWNLLVAPAMYGNGPARSYLDRVSTDFDGAFVEADGGETAGGGAKPELPRLTSRLVVTANDLDAQETLYFKFVPDGEPCSRVRRRPGSPSLWRTYSVNKSGEPIRAVRPGDEACDPLPEVETRERTTPGEQARGFLTDAVFASGSPFPIFPAARVSFSGSVARRLVDGGYSNNVPVDAALTLGATRVLIVRSSNPLGSKAPPPKSAEGGWQATLGSPIGSLAGNLDRIPGYLFERSQQVDKLSQRELFVVSLSPSVPDDDWPPLFDFRTTTVEWMKEVAAADTSRRIGMVESWGVPVRRLAILISRSGARSSSGDRPAPAPAQVR